MHILSRRLQILLDEHRYARLTAYAEERNLSVGAAVREAIDKVVPVTSSEREAAARKILTAPAMTVPAPGTLRRELDTLRGRRA